MNDSILFSEKQKFNQWWIWLLFIGLDALLIYGIISQIVFKIPFGNNPINDVGLILISAILFSLTCMMITLRLETKIKQNGIYVRFFPLQTTFKYYSWENISKIYVRVYKPISEYGGWGIRGFGKNKAFNVSGNQGLQLEIDGSEKILIGTQKPIELKETLAKLGHYTNDSIK